MVFESNQLFFILLLFIWLFFISEYLNMRHTNNSIMIALMQFSIMFPLIIILADICFNYVFGYIMVFIIPIFSLYILADSIYYRNKNKKK